jgi:hypothetical protein
MLRNTNCNIFSTLHHSSRIHPIRAPEALRPKADRSILLKYLYKILINSFFNDYLLINKCLGSDLNLSMKLTELGGWNHAVCLKQEFR